ncbi:MAG: hypothetical protein KF861_08530 [Planctomycetaceae bacterium]|nr:hypothetical protein [Planctomycetaceae bacterium]
MDQTGSNSAPRLSVGAHYHVWWFWLPFLLGGISLLVAGVVFPLVPQAGIAFGVATLGCGLWAFAAAAAIRRGRRWLEVDDSRMRIVDREGEFEFGDDQVTDLALFRTLHHAGGRLVAVTREVRLWVETSDGARVLRLVNRMAPSSGDPLDHWIEAQRDRLTRRAVERLTHGEPIEGEHWTLDQQSLCVMQGAQQLTLPIESVSAVEIIGQEVRVWRDGVPRAVVRMPLSGRNTWIVERLLSNVADCKPPRPLAARLASPTGPLGRILFERTTGAAVSVLIVALGIAVATIGIVVIAIASRAGEPIGAVVGGLVAVIGGLCLISGLRVRRIRFACHEYGLERVTLTGRQVLSFSQVDVFSFESRRNRSHGRYTGTTYTLVFADRSREQGRGIFFSTTVHNTDEELEMLRDRLSVHIARRMAAAFAQSGRVQWTPELWFREDVLEFSRPRRLFSGPKLTVVPYDAVTDFDIRDGRFYLWTNYQERAVISVKTASANFFPGLVVLDGLVNTHRRPAASRWSPSAAVGG